MAGSTPLSPLPKDASESERQFAEQWNKVVELAKTSQFHAMPSEQKYLERLKLAVRAERLAAKRAKAAE